MARSDQPLIQTYRLWHRLTRGDGVGWVNIYPDGITGTVHLHPWESFTGEELYRVKIKIRPNLLTI